MITLIPKDQPDLRPGDTVWTIVHRETSQKLFDTITKKLIAFETESESRSCIDSGQLRDLGASNEFAAVAQTIDS